MIHLKKRVKEWRTERDTKREREGEREKERGRKRTEMQQTDIKRGRKANSRLNHQSPLILNAIGKIIRGSTNTHYFTLFKHCFPHLTKSFAGMLIQPFITLLHHDNSIAEPLPNEWSHPSPASTRQYLHVTLQWFNSLSTALTMCTIPLINSVTALTISH